ncbi:heat shock protein Hsp-16.1/Hsp-16.11-like [Dermatophagoides pteronyssinus]|uniref:Heat shock protein Hsp-16.1/Hsp-16.11-like n=2 Tax=Dermatophagoides pteronyssinus TaxID=6956 RepID=A0A6P6Y7X3_DERPT|nr:heat shock protein Hsp-16.1/Hsp-16.11-like [Dermatophagoides pteronyssinus]XP_027201111.1 heat shock protein Hsp-16.1/Hsp-16.11-like [Dermatophagoides pteronyssinus]KAH9412972.1 hypothetical protein DERP_013954 [Dermatophagoides pteronyssinus]
MLSIPRSSYWDDDDMFAINPYCSYHRPRSSWLMPALDRFLTLDEMVAQPSSMIKNGKFQADLDLRNFDPNGINVKLDGNTLQVNAKQEKKGEGHYEFREFKRMISIPKEVAEDQMKCKLDKDGRLRIEAPLKKQMEIDEKGRNIPIEMVNQKK